MSSACPWLADDICHDLDDILRSRDICRQQSSAPAAPRPRHHRTMPETESDEGGPKAYDFKRNKNKDFDGGTSDTDWREKEEQFEGVAFKDLSEDVKNAVRQAWKKHAGEECLRYMRATWAAITKPGVTLEEQVTSTAECTCVDICH